ncbi:MAG: hypothetical protein ABI254_06970, partial [Chthoniobacterales bacterium]
TVVLNNGGHRTKTMAFYERMLFQDDETYGELVMHVSIYGIKRFIDEISNVIDAAQKGMDFDFRFHPYESDYIFPGQASLTLCCGSEWTENLMHIKNRGASISDEPWVREEELNDALKWAEKYAPLQQ